MKNILKDSTFQHFIIDHNIPEKDFIKIIETATYVDVVLDYIGCFPCNGTSIELPDELVNHLRALLLLDKIPWRHEIY